MAFDIEAQDSGQRQPFFEGAHGYLLFTPESRMMALVVSEGRQPGQTEERQAALFRSMLSYTGLYRCEGDKFITAVDASWNEAWSGTEQVRFYKIDGDRLDILSPWMPSMPHPMAQNPHLSRHPVLGAREMIAA